MKIIKLLNSDRPCLVDDDDFDRLNLHKWSLKDNGRHCYVLRQLPLQGKIRPYVYLHRMAINAPEDKLVDHKDGDTLNNQKSNLRLCDYRQNGANRKYQAHSSKYKGVSWWKLQKKWCASIVMRKGEGSVKLPGYFTDEREAALVYDNAATELFGEFALTNRKLGLL